MKNLLYVIRSCVFKLHLLLPIISIACATNKKEKSTPLAKGLKSEVITGDEGRAETVEDGGGDDVTRTPFTNETLRAAVQEYVHSQKAAIEKYGPIGGWNVSQVTDMSYMFYGATAFDQDIGGWNVSSVTNMSNMFEGATSFNQDISRWDVRQVTAMRHMFLDAARMRDREIPESPMPIDWDNYWPRK